MPSKILKTVEPENQTDEIEFDTYQFETLRAPRGKYLFLENMPQGAHHHFRSDFTKTLPNSINELNRRLAKQGSGIHFAVHRVGDNDPRGPGYRVLRDDIPIVRRPRKAREVKP